MRALGLFPSVSQAKFHTYIQMIVECLIFDSDPQEKALHSHLDGLDEVNFDLFLKLLYKYASFSCVCS